MLHTRRGQGARRYEGLDNGALAGHEDNNVRDDMNGDGS